ncbi:MAG: type II toxin-antitoxin system RatA family toxin [Rhodocyclaceae bacterium]|nr:type II toxin-antitoxin system RatA family toxin [Rhodocyclaceae bacterium]
MAIIEKSVLIARTAQQMFDLVDGVEDYPKFLPWCGGTELLERTADITAARIHINYHGITAHFATENPKEAPYRMDIRLREGPFRRLEGGWRFTALGDAGCKVEFRLNYEFSSKILEKALGPVFGLIVGTFVESFVKRAYEVYA